MLNPPLLVFTPGLGLNGDEWRSVRAELRAPSLVLLLPSIGQPAPRRADLQVEAQAIRLLNRLPQNRTVILIAHSASCPVAVEVATRSRHVVGLVLVGPVTDPEAASWPALLVQWARTAVHEPLWQVPVLVRQWRRTGPLSMLRGMNALRRFRTDLALQSVTVPVAIIRGDKDRIAAHAWSTTLLRVSNGHLRSVEGAAHMVPLTHPEAVATAVDRILSAHEQSAHESPI